MTAGGPVKAEGSGVRARAGRFARMKTWQILRDCPLTSDDGVHRAMLGIARMHNGRRPRRQ